MNNYLDNNKEKKKLLIWGTGQLCWQIVRDINEDEIVGYIDTYAKSCEFAGKQLYKPKDIKEIQYDAILVSTIFSKEIYEICKKENIELDRVIFCYGNVYSVDLNDNYEFVEQIVGTRLCEIIRNRYHMIREIDVGLDKKNNKEYSIDEFKNTSKMYVSDYVRVKTFELLSEEIKKRSIKGETAELGVFRGDFAEIINAAFPNRTLYLFDTFEGFPEEEIRKELTGDMLKATVDAYKKTSVDVVMDRMRYPERIVIRKGIFPDTADGLDEKFAFVSLDCDWEESLYHGLEFFYPRLSGGGYIMVHDYNNSIECASKAIDRYEKENNMIIPKVPICDTQGSIILTK